MVQPEWRLRLEGEGCLVRRDEQGGGAPRRVAVCRCTSVSVGGFSLAVKRPAEFVEVSVKNGAPSDVAGDAEQLRDISLGAQTT